MRIAHAIQHFPPHPGGAEQQARTLARELADRLGACDVVTSRHRQDLTRESREGSVRVVRLPTLPAGPGRAIANLVAAFGYFARHGGRYDVVHGHCLSPFVLGAVLGARLRGCRTLVKICTVGERGDIAKVRRHGLGPWLWRGFRAADLFFATSPDARDEAIASGVAPERIALLPNAIPIPASRAERGGSHSHRTADSRLALGLPSAGICLFAGRWVEGKGLDVLMRAWPTIHARHDATLVIVGAGPLADVLASWARSAEIHGSVRLVDWQSDLTPYYSAADVLLAPSATEAFGNVVAEAMAHGLPVVTTPVGLAQVWIRDGENACLLRADRHTLAGELARATLTLLADEAMRRRIGANAQATAFAAFGCDAVLDECIALYRRLLAHTPTRTAAESSAATRSS